MTLAPSDAGHGDAVGHRVEVAELDDGDAGQRVRRCDAVTCGGLGRASEGVPCSSSAGAERSIRDGVDAEAGERADLLHGAVTGSTTITALAVVADLRVVETLLAEAGQLEGDVGVGEEDRLPVAVRSWCARPPRAGPPTSCASSAVANCGCRAKRGSSIVCSMPTALVRACAWWGEQLGEDRPSARPGSARRSCSGSHRSPPSIADGASRASPVVRWACCHVMVPK